MKRFIKYIVIASFVGALQIWGNNSDVAKDFFEKWVEPLFDKFTIPLVWPIIAALALIEFHMSRVSELESDMKNEMELQIKAHKQLSAYRRKDLLHNFVESYVEREDAVQAVQLYKYTLKRKTGEIEVKVEYVDGCVHEGIGLNALVQIYFHLDKSMYRDFISAKAALDKHQSIYSLINFVQQYRSNFTRLTPDSVDENNSTQFSMLQLAVDLIKEWLLENYSQPIELNLLDLPEDTLIKLNEVKRTGILRTILLMNSYYRFFHTRPGEKHGRLYLARQLFLWDVNHVFMITIDPDILDESTALEQLDQIQVRFVSGLQNSFDIVYTRDNDSSRGDRHEQAE